MNMIRYGVRKFVYDMHRPSLLKGDLVGLCLDGNWEICVRGCSGEIMSIYAVIEGAAGISNEKALL